MAIELPENWSGFSGGSGATCELSTPTISADGNMDCHGGASVTLTVSGGVGPYSWSTTLGELDTNVGSTVVLTPPTNPYTGAAGTDAYRMTTKAVETFCFCRTTRWDCYGTEFQTCLGINPCWPTSCTCVNCTTAADAVCDVNCTPSCVCGKSPCADSFGCPEVNAHHFCTSGTGDCQPCAITMEGGAVVTVTDSLGQSAFVTVDTIPGETID